MSNAICSRRTYQIDKAFILKISSPHENLSETTTDMCHKVPDVTICIGSTFK